MFVTHQNKIFKRLTTWGKILMAAHKDAQWGLNHVLDAPLPTQLPAVGLGMEWKMTHVIGPLHLC